MTLTTLILAMIGGGIALSILELILWFIIQLLFFLGAPFAVISGINVVMFCFASKKRRMRGTPIPRRRWVLNILFSVIGILLMLPAMGMTGYQAYHKYTADISVPISTAAAGYDEQLVKTLLDHGADPNEPDELGITPLMEATDPDIIQLLVDYGADINTKNKEGHSALQHQVSKGFEMSSQAVLCLLKNGADPNEVDSKTGETPLLAACTYMKDISVFLQYGADANLKNANGDAPIHIAVGRSDYVSTRYGMIKVLLENGADPDIQDGNGKTALYIACNNKYENILIIKTLLEGGANTNFTGSRTSLLEPALKAGNYDLVDLLLEYNANTEYLPKDYQDRLVYCLYYI